MPPGRPPGAATSPRTGQASGSNGIPAGSASVRWAAKFASLSPKLALPKSYALGMSRIPAG